VASWPRAWLAGDSQKERTTSEEKRQVDHLRLPHGELAPQGQTTECFPQPDEIAEEVYRCWNEGASICHIHCRDREGNATSDSKVFAETD